MDRLTPPPDVGASLITYLEEAFGKVAVLGDLIEILTGVEDGDTSDLGTWVNSLMNGTGVENLIAAALHALASLLDMIPIVGTTLDELVTNIADGINSTNSTAVAAQNTANSKPDITAIPINALSTATVNTEDTTFTRAQLMAGASSSSGSGGSSTASAHTHSMDQIPQYKPAGNGSAMGEIGFIRTRVNKVYNYVGFATGGSATFAGISSAHIGVYSMNPTTGDLTLITPLLATVDLRSTITTANKEFHVSLGSEAITAAQGDIYAVMVCQGTSVIQTCANMLCSTLSDVAKAGSGVLPTKQYGYRDLSSVSGVLPSTLIAGNINYSASTKLPFYILGT